MPQLEKDVRKWWLRGFMVDEIAEILAIDPMRIEHVVNYLGLPDIF